MKHAVGSEEKIFYFLKKLIKFFTVGMFLKGRSGYRKQKYFLLGLMNFANQSNHCFICNQCNSLQSFKTKLLLQFKINGSKQNLKRFFHCNINTILIGSRKPQNN